MMHSLRKTFLIVFCFAFSVYAGAQEIATSEVDSIIRRISTLVEDYLSTTIYNDTSDYEHGYPDSKNINLLIAASEGDCYNIVRLIAGGADVNNFVGKNATPLHYGVSSGRLNAVEILLLLSADTEKKDIFGNTSLITAVKANNLEMSELLIRHGASLSATDHDGSTPLHHAVALNDFYLSDMLIYYGAPTDTTDNEGDTPLMVAVWRKSYDIAEILLRSGADPNITDKRGFSPFLLATQAGDTLMMRILSNYRADPYAVNNDGYNAISIAARNNRKEALSFLMENFFLWKARTERTVNPVDVAINFGNSEMVSQLKSYGYSGTIHFSLEDFSVSAGGLVTNHYSMISAGIILKDPYLKIGIIAGTYFNPARTRLLVLGEDNNIFQYRVKTTVIYTGFFKEFAISRSLSEGKLSIVSSLSAGYRFHSYYSGTRIKPEDRFCIIPYAGVEWNRKGISIRPGLSYLNTPFYKVSPLWLNMGLSVDLYKDHTSVAGKRIRIYTYE